MRLRTDVNEHREVIFLNIINLCIICELIMHINSKATTSLSYEWCGGDPVNYGLRGLPMNFTR
jgi:hypothetical protein